MSIDSIKLHAAYVAGDIPAIRREMGEPESFPNARGPLGLGEIVLEYAIYHSPLACVRELLAMGADPNYEDHAGFPSIIAALSSERVDRSEIIELLLAHGADIQERGLNGYTPLHWAAATADEKVIRLLLEHGADPEAKTTVDDYATPEEELDYQNHTEALETYKRILRDFQISE